VAEDTLAKQADLAVRLREPRHNLKEGLLKKSKLAKHAYKEGHKFGWDEARILDIESHGKYINTKKRPIWLALSIRLANPL
jgi:hypothetical protein